ncbi:MAG TPA: glycosyltransferase family 39 protein [Dehalococcoidia bacterium]|nr:glycosyltransferase family 39 protein [Dehalococcoidia bacterium]
MKRTLDYVRRREGPFVAAVLAAVALFYAATTLPNIGNHPIAGGDEGWIVSASTKLAEEGVFGSDLFAGFFGADRHYYFNLPLHHLVLAGVFEVFGAGLEQARLTSAFFGGALLLLTYLLGSRTAGRWAGAGAAALLVLLRLNLTPFTGLTLTDLGATVRYDLVATPFAVGAALVLLRRGGSPGPADAAGAGIVLGLGCLTQFVAAFFVVPLALFLLTTPAAARRRVLHAALFAACTALPFVPYFVYAAQDWEDFRGQARTVEQRSDFFSPQFYIDNLVSEADRYDLALDIDTSMSPAELFERPSARLTLLIAGPAALAYAAVRARRGSAPHRLLALVLGCLVLEFALFESTKRFVYWVIAVPFLCVALAEGGRALLSWRPPSRPMGRAASIAVLLAALMVAAEGAAVGIRNVSDARNATVYATVGDAVREVVPAGSRVVTDNRMWLALPDLETRSLLLLFYWTNPEISRGETTDIEGAMGRLNADYLLLSPLTKEILAKLTPADSERFQRYLTQKGRLVATVAGPPYGPIEVYRLER